VEIFLWVDSRDQPVKQAITPAIQGIMLIVHAPQELEGAHDHHKPQHCNELDDEPV
jgi:hypothetical protein